MKKIYSYFISTLRDAEPVKYGEYKKSNDFIYKTSKAFSFFINALSDNQLCKINDELDAYNNATIGIDIVNKQTNKPEIGYTLNITMNPIYYK